MRALWRHYLSNYSILCHSVHSMLSLCLSQSDSQWDRRQWSHCTCSRRRLSWPLSSWVFGGFFYGSSLSVLLEIRRFFSFSFSLKYKHKTILSFRNGHKLERISNILTLRCCFVVNRIILEGHSGKHRKSRTVSLSLVAHVGALWLQYLDITSRWE